jgi:hypothetical protein
LKGGGFSWLQVLQRGQASGETVGGGLAGGHIAVERDQRRAAQDEAAGEEAEGRDEDQHANRDQQTLHSRGAKAHVGGRVRHHVAADHVAAGGGGLVHVAAGHIAAHVTAHRDGRRAGQRAGGRAPQPRLGVRTRPAGAGRRRGGVTGLGFVRLAHLH